MLIHLILICLTFDNNKKKKVKVKTTIQNYKQNCLTSFT